MPFLETNAVAGSSARHLPAVWLWLAGALLVARGAVHVYQHGHPPRLRDLVQWVDVTVAKATAKKQGMPVLYDFSATWCAPCKQMNKEIFSNTEYASMINEKFVPVRIYDDDSGAAVDKLRKRFNIRAYPTLVLTSSSGKEFKSHRGYGGVNGTLRWLKKTAAGLK